MTPIEKAVEALEAALAELAECSKAVQIQERVQDAITALKPLPSGRVVAWGNPELTAFQTAAGHAAGDRHPALKLLADSYPVPLTFAHPPLVPLDAAGVVIKPLEWRDDGYEKGPTYFAWTPFWDYTVRSDSHHEYPWVVKPFPGKGAPSNYKTLDEAKAAAEKDYMERMGSALLSSKPEAGQDFTREELDGMLKAVENGLTPYVKIYIPTGWNVILSKLRAKIDAFPQPPKETTEETQGGAG